ncbi:hypothetical protein [Delftia sp. UGAL515B_04]|uniref:hypothetical protein n=1 Tax=Delftia sp. UGAL515B_04 TaxID=2986766 RepID=UPI00295504BF|nr:hypothetical protein [Delftia sp. UGAL515B_04]WON89008.1 hypothetical protein OK021_30535 [Delftia sp. UGAL515B_04]
MTMINTPLVLLAQQCGATFHTPGPMRAIRGMAFTFDQLDALAERLRAEAGQQQARSPGAAVRAFREYLAVHPDLQMDGQAMDDMALGLARVALDFPAVAVAPAAPAVPAGYVAPKGRYVPPVLFSPYTGEPRDARDIASDPQGVLIVPPGANLLAAAPQAPSAPSYPPAFGPNDWVMSVAGTVVKLSEWEPGAVKARTIYGEAAPAAPTVGSTA